MSDDVWGRVDPDGTVWVRTADGERTVGQYPGATPEEALAYFTRKYDDLQAQVTLLEQRIAAGHVTGADVTAASEKLVAAITDANAVGDLAGLLGRLDALAPLAQAQREAAEAAKAQAREAALAERRAVVDEAEAIAGVEPERIMWKQSGDRLRDLFEQWRTMQREHRLDRSAEDELWKRFSHARTTFDRKRRQHFGALDEARAQARATKQAIVARAEELADSTDWGATAGAYRELMADWKAAGRASKSDDDALWQQFKAAQDRFFAARSAQNEQAEAEFQGNLEVKEALLVEAEALLPVKDLGAAKAALRGIQDRWDAAGKVPRADLSRVEARLRAVEQAVREAEEKRWKRSNPEARARAQALVTQLEAALAQLGTKLDKARARGDERAAASVTADITARQAWLDEARKGLDEFSA